MFLAHQESAASPVPLPHATRLQELYKKQVGGEKKSLKLRRQGRVEAIKSSWEEGREEEGRREGRRAHETPPRSRMQLPPYVKLVPRQQSWAKGVGEGLGV